MSPGRVELEHPTQASRVRLNLYQHQPADREGVTGMMPEEPGWFVTEERVGTATVVASLGFYATEAAARERLERRAHELAGQGYRPASSAALEQPPAPGALTSSEPAGARAARAAAGEPQRALTPGDPTPRPVKPAS